MMDFIILAFASFRLTRLIVFDKITAFIRSPFFNEIEETNQNGEIILYYVPKDGLIKNFFGELLSCYWCTGVWSTVLLCIVYLYFPAITAPILLVLSVAGMAALIETILQLLLKE